MSFKYPLGLLGLIGVPVLILIYILKNKHTEQVVSSTYLWRLSEKFLKKRNPISRITGIISLILQILAVIAISLAIAHPVINLPNAANDYVFVLDASGSMHYKDGNKTRFEKAKEEISDKIDGAANGSSYTLISVGETAGVVYEKLTDKRMALDLLDEVEISATATNFSSASGFAQQIFTQTPSSKIYLLTDKSYDELSNVTLVQIGTRARNYALSDLKQSVVNGKLTVTGIAYAYEDSAELELEISATDANGVELWEPSKNDGTVQELTVKMREETEFRFEVENVNFQSITVRIANAAALRDELDLDDVSVLYSVNDSAKAEEEGILVVSDDPFFIQSALTTIVGPNTVKTLSKKEYDSTQNGYQMYVFEGYSPEILPSDGAIWFINPKTSVDNTGFSVQGAEPLGAPVTLQYSNSTASRIQELLQDTIGDDIYLDEYVKCSFYRSFHTLLTYAGNPIVFAGTNSYENRQVVFSFDFHKSNFVLKPDALTLIRNLYEFTFPSMVDETSFECGKPMYVNVLSNSQSVRIDTPKGGIVYFDVGSDIVEYVPTEVGTYKITQVVDDVSHVVYAYGNLPKEERFSQAKEQAFTVQGTPSKEGRDGKYEDLLILFIILAVIFIADWVVYSYEQYQLR